MKHIRIADLLERRIRSGDYALTGIPAERDLADEIGVSRITLRKSLQELERNGLLERAPNRRLVLTPKAHSAVGKLELAIVLPSIGPTSFSPDLQLWLSAAESLASKRGVRLRAVNYRHWDDPALTEAIRAYDGIFLVPSSEPIPSWTSEVLANSERIVALSEDLTHFDIPSIVLFPPKFIGSMLDQLRARGHRRIDCINVQGHNLITEARIREWEIWLHKEDIGGVLVDEPCGTEDNIYEAGIETAHRWMRNLDDETAAVICITLPAALGVLRAASEAGLLVGDQLSVCTIDCEGIGKYINPAIASFERPNPVDFMDSCVDWFAKNGTLDKWNGPLLLEPQELEIFVGGSIGGPLQTS